MTMLNLISKRMAEGARNLPPPTNKRLSPHVSARVEAMASLDEWEAEGGASAGVPQAGGPGAESPPALELGQPTKPAAGTN